MKVLFYAVIVAAIISCVPTADAIAKPRPNPNAPAREIPNVRDGEVPIEENPCERLKTTPSPFLEYACERMTVPVKVQDRCIPVYRMPEGEVRGAVVMFHGFSACPDSMIPLANDSASRGIAVYAPLIVGHGNDKSDCPDKKNPQCFQKENIHLLPTSRFGYMDWIKQINKVMEAEVQSIKNKTLSFSLSVGGLSLGANLAILAVDNAPHLYTNLVPVNPFLGLADIGIDATAEVCTSSIGQCIQKIVSTLIPGKRKPRLPPAKFETIDPTVASESSTEQTVTNNGTATSASSVAAPVRRRLGWLAKTVANIVRPLGLNLRKSYPDLMSAVQRALVWVNAMSDKNKKRFLNEPFGWGGFCESNVVRGGICTTALRHMLTVQDVGDEAMSASARLAGNRMAFGNGTGSAFIFTVESDGPSRNALIATAARRLSAPVGLVASSAAQHSVGGCMYRVKANCKKHGNLCGVPHSNLGWCDNPKIQPKNNLYWEKNMHDLLFGVVSNKNNQQLVQDGTLDATYKGDITRCSAVPGFTVSQTPSRPLIATTQNRLDALPQTLFGLSRYFDVAFTLLPTPRTKQFATLRETEAAFVREKKKILKSIYRSSGFLTGVFDVLKKPTFVSATCAEITDAEREAMTVGEGRFWCRVVVNLPEKHVNGASRNVRTLLNMKVVRSETF